MSLDASHSPRLTRCSVVAAAAALAFFTAACSGNDSTGPTPISTAPTVVSVSPPSGTTAGGTEITITGTNFVTGATVTVGGTAATNVRVSSPTVILAVTPPHAAGASAVVVTVGTQSGTLTSGFTYNAPSAPTVTAVSPVSGSTAGGTSVTITGTGFSEGATVKIGGVAAVGVSFLGPTMLSAVTGAHVSGPVDVVVTVGSTTATLAGGFRYVAPAVNPAPVITSLVAKGTKDNEPVGYADLGETLNVIATVTDAETAPSDLIFEWSATAGTITGTGRAVTWTAPATSATMPLAVTITLKVTEMLGVSGGAAEDPASAQSVTATAAVDLHDAAAEVGALAVRFLVEFSQQTLTPASIVRDFYDGCSGKAAELDDVTNNQKNWKITSYTIGAPTFVTLNFGGTCALGEKGDACTGVPCDWHDIRLSDKEVGSTTGIDLLSAVYRQKRWWLCSSRFSGTSTHTALEGAVPFMR